MHAARFWRELIHQTRRSTQPLSDLAGTPVGALGAAFKLAFVGEAMAQPAAEARPAIQDAALAMASWTSEPLLDPPSDISVDRSSMLSSTVSVDPSDVVV